MMGLLTDMVCKSFVVLTTSTILFVVSRRLTYLCGSDGLSNVF